MLKALSKNPANRYQSAGEMRADLLRASAGRPVLATPVLREEQTVPMTSPARTGTNRNAPLGSATPAAAALPGWVIATLTALGVLAVVALTAGLILASQPKDVPVPDLFGLTKQQARAAVTAAGLEPRLGDPLRQSDCTEKTVAKQDPAKGHEVREQERGHLPDLRWQAAGQGAAADRLNRANAESQLTGLKLVPEFKERDAEEPAGQVLETNPKVGEMISEGGTVTVFISKGLVKVPSLVGKSQAEAIAILTGLGLDNKVVPGDRPRIRTRSAACRNRTRRRTPSGPRAP